MCVLVFNSKCVLLVFSRVVLSKYYILVNCLVSMALADLVIEQYGNEVDEYNNLTYKVSMISHKKKKKLIDDHYFEIKIVNEHYVLTAPEYAFNNFDRTEIAYIEDYLDLLMPKTVNLLKSHVDKMYVKYELWEGDGKVIDKTEDFIFRYWKAPPIPPPSNDYPL